MKKQLLLGSALFAAISVFPQNGAKKPKSNLLENTKIIAELKFSEDEMGSNKKNVHTVQEMPNELNAKSSALNTWQKISGSMNVLNSVISYGNPLQYNDELNVVSFIHRKSPTYTLSPAPAGNAASGVIVGMVSADWGATWDSTVLWSNNSEWARYPQGGVYNPTGNTNINNAYIIAQGPTTGAATGWLGNYYASRQLGSANYSNTVSIIPNEMQFMSKTAPYAPGLGRHDFAAYCFTSTDDGKVRTIGGISNETTASDSAIMLVTGNFNAGTFMWTGTQFNPPTLTNSNSSDEEWVSRPMTAWNETGTTGYVVAIGARSGATGSNKGYQPIVYKTTNSGTSWSLLPGIDFNNPAFDDVKRSIAAANNSTLEIPYFNWIEGIDIAVDANDKLHIFSSIIGSVIDHPDSLAYITSFTLSVNPGENYRWPHLPGFRPYLYDFIGDGSAAWTHVTVDSMSSEGPSGLPTGNGFADNPWDVDASGNKVRVDARLQLGRTPDGQHIIYTWAESDTNFTNGGRKWNNIPNVKARCYSVGAGTVLPNEINVTKPATGANPNVSSRAMYHFMSPRTSSAAPVGGITITMPISVTNGNPYTQTAPQHWYMSATLNFTVSGVSENALNSASSSVVYPNPATNNATLAIDLKDNSAVDITLLNTIGQLVKTTKAQGQIGENAINIDLNGLSSGIYFVTVKVGNATSTKKLVVQ
ncbi:MAG: T9SS type A sorting domain-containing protein [Bacteroidota bacterium]|nr:T9SS type A sorting domain-containing protein [Bacteroidota bacterium]MDP3144360.1 T9SS type A sorting domain-containing protein [Bacteroidota bacterium]